MSPEQQMVMDRSTPEPNSGCWLWDKSINSRGYGNICIGGCVSVAHVFSFKAFRGTVPSGHYVCHKCDTPACCNPDHLFLGTYKDNMQDMVNKKRSAWHKRAQIRANREAFPDAGKQVGGNAT